MSRTQLWALANKTTKFNLKARYFLNILKKTLGFFKNSIEFEFVRQNLTFVYITFINVSFQNQSSSWASQAPHPEDER